MKLALITASEVLKIWTLPTGGTELAIRYTLPDGGQVSPICEGWTDDTYSVVAVTEFEVPEGKVTVGPPTYSLDNGEVTEAYTVEDYRPMVRKSTVQARLITVGKMEAAYAALTSNPVYFARWFAPDQPRVYCDDPDSLILLATIEADAETIMAPEEE